MDFLYGVIGGLLTGFAVATIRYSYREEGLLRRLAQETNRANTWRSNYCYPQSRMDAERDAEKRAAVEEAMRIVTTRQEAA